MDTDRLMSVVTCATSLVTTVFVALVCLPHMKQGLVIVRDITLWIAFVVIVGAIGWIGWTQYGPLEWRLPASNENAVPAPVTAPASVSAPADSRSSDPYFVRVTAD